MEYDTKEAGAGSYPQEPEKSEYKCYNFTATTSSVIKGYIRAKSKEEAETMINFNGYDEIEEREEEVEEIVSIEEENEQ